MKLSPERSERPPKVWRAVIMLYATLGIGILKAVIRADSLGAMGGTGRIIVMSLMVSAMSAMFIALIGMGKNWARITHLVLVLLGMPSSVSRMLDSFQFHAFFGMLSVVQMTLQIWALILLFQSDSSAWFRRQSAGRPAPLKHEELTP